MHGDPLFTQERVRTRDENVAEVHHGGYKGNRYISEAAGRLMAERNPEWDASMFGDEVVK